MLAESGIHSPTWQARVIVLEDHNETVECICKVLMRDGKTVTVAKNLADFEQHLTSGTFDAGSVDWNINNRFVGLDALEKLNTYVPDAGKVVYSVHADEERVKADAKQERADFILEKIGDNFDEYLIRVEEAARLGLSRKIARDLKAHDLIPRHMLEEAAVISPLNKEFEAFLYERSRQVALNQFVAGESNGLAELVKHRGWWRILNLKHFSELNPADQIGQLFQYVNGQPAELAKILECDLLIATEILTLELQYEHLSGGVKQFADKILSVLSYVLRLSAYEPDVMSHYWTATNLFAGSLSSPPWDQLGMTTYLQSRGREGIDTALYWIRNN